jgi:ABC-type phosphate transport system substrate-binding protein
MSAFKQKLARIGATAGVLAASTAAFMAVGGVTAGSALATPTCQTISGVSTLQGEGSTLQKVAQIELWTPAYTTACPTGVHFNYTGTGSGAALTAFAYNGSSINTGEAYVGTDEAPTSTQITNAKTVSGASPVIIPVAQTSIAIVANLPAGCTISEGITWKDLNKIFSGADKKWSDISTSSGCGSNEITRVVREDGSGTTFQFKNYLSTLEGKGGVPAGNVETGVPTVGHAPVCTSEKWGAIRNNSSTPSSPNLNLNWPENVHTVGGIEEGCSTAGTLSPIVRANGGGGVVNLVKTTPNTVGYAAYSDVVANSAIADAQPLQNLEETGEKFYAAPGTGSGSKQANCEGRQYTVPSSSTGLEVDWSAVFGANPNIGISGEVYPLCTLTYDLSWHGATSGFANAGYGTHAAEIGKAVKDYILREVLEGGQSLLNTHGYEALPSTEGVTHEVLKAAKLAAEEIN